MHIILITTLYPTKLVPYGGTFINERMKQLDAHQINYKSYIIVNKYSRLIRVLNWLRSSVKPDGYEPIAWCHSDKSVIVENNVSLLNYIIWKINPLLEEKRLFKLLSSMKIEIYKDTVIHAHYLYPLGYCAVKLAKKLNVPCIVTSHDMLAIETIGKKNKKIIKGIYDTLSKTDKIIYVSNSILNKSISCGCSNINAIVIPNGVDINLYRPIEHKLVIQKTHFIQSKKYIVGFVGTISYVKRADKFPEIFKYIQNEINDVEFILVGSGHLTQTTLKRCGEIGLTVTATGPIPPSDVPYWMNLFDVLIIPSRYEAWGCVIREAYACGVPVVGSDVEGIPEAMGNLGCIVNEGEDFEKKFAHAVSNVLTGKTHISTGELIKLASESTWAECVNKEVLVYKSILHLKSI